MEKKDRNEVFDIRWIIGMGEKAKECIIISLVNDNCESFFIMRWKKIEKVKNCKKNYGI